MFVSNGRNAIKRSIKNRPNGLLKKKKYNRPFFSCHGVDVLNLAVLLIVLVPLFRFPVLIFHCLVVI